MRKNIYNIFLLAIALILSTESFAQTEPSTPKGKSSYKNFWNYVKGSDEKSLRSAMSYLKDIKKNEPGFNTDEMYKELKSLKIKVYGSDGASRPNTTYGNERFDQFWKNIAEEDLDKASVNWERLLEAEPDYKNTKMEKALNDLEKKSEQAESAREKSIQDKNDAVMLAVDLSQIIKILFTERDLYAYSDNLSDAAQKNADYEKWLEKMQAIIKEINNKQPGKAEKYLAEAEQRVIDYYLKNNEDVVKNLSDEINNTTDPTKARTNYISLLYRKAYWQVVQKIYPKNSDFAKAYKISESTLKAFGSLEQINKNVDKNYLAMVNKRRLPDAVVKDPNLEIAFKNAFVTSCKATNREYVFVKAIITSSDYIIIRNQNTGVVTQRARDGVIVFKSNGKCYYNDYRIYQEFVGNSFTGAQQGYFQESYIREINCTFIQ